MLSNVVWLLLVDHWVHMGPQTTTVRVRVRVKGSCVCCQWLREGVSKVSLCCKSWVLSHGLERSSLARCGLCLLPAPSPPPPATKQPHLGDCVALLQEMEGLSKAGVVFYGINLSVGLSVAIPGFASDMAHGLLGEMPFGTISIVGVKVRWLAQQCLFPSNTCHPPAHDPFLHAPCLTDAPACSPPPPPPPPWAQLTGSGWCSQGAHVWCRPAHTRGGGAPSLSTLCANSHTHLHVAPCPPPHTHIHPPPGATYRTWRVHARHTCLAPTRGEGA